MTSAKANDETSSTDYQNTKEPIVYEIRSIELESTIRKSEIGKILEQEKHPQGTNCVFFVKDAIAKKKKRLPSGLTTLKAKVDLINSHTPHVGDIVITDESIYGHLSIVLEVRDDAIVIEEGNYIHGYRTVRIISKDFPLGYRT